MLYVELTMTEKAPYIVAKSPLSESPDSMRRFYVTSGGS